MLGIGLRGEMGTMGSIQQDRKLLGDRKLLQDWICQSLGWDSAPQRVPRTWQGKSWGWRRGGGGGDASVPPHSWSQGKPGRQNGNFPEVKRPGKVHFTKLNFVLLTWTAPRALQSKQECGSHPGGGTLDVTEEGFIPHHPEFLWIPGILNSLPSALLGSLQPSPLKQLHFAAKTAFSGVKASAAISWMKALTNRASHQFKFALE